MDAELSPTEVQELLEREDSDVRVVDIRPARSFDRGHIPESENIPFHALADRIDSLDGADHVVTVCPHGKSSVQAARLIASYEGVSDDATVASMAGGLDEWDHGLEAAERESSEQESDDGPESPF